jgi:hypothetical protein
LLDISILNGCKYSYICELGIDKDAAFAISIACLIIWYLFRKIQYQRYANSHYSNIERKQRIFYGRSCLEYRRILPADLRNMYLRYLIEIRVLFTLALAVLFL